MISEGSFPSAPKIAREYEGVSIITIKRDIEHMRNILKAPIEYEKNKKGYYYSDKTFRLPLLFVNEEEIFAGYNYFINYKGTPVCKYVKIFLIILIKL